MAAAEEHGAREFANFISDPESHGEWYPKRINDMFARWLATREGELP
jgi:hypothetical protein